MVDSTSHKVCQVPKRVLSRPTIKNGCDDDGHIPIVEKLRDKKVT